MRVILMGYMGSGKTTVGKKLSEIISLPFIDLDDYTVRQERLSIDNIFLTRGESYFRNREKHYLNDIISKNAVIALGGGTPCYGKNIDLINAKTKNVFYLKLSVKTLSKRLKKQKKSRPIISDIEDDDLDNFIANHILKRSPFYNKSNHTIDCEGLSIEQIVNTIVSKSK